MWTSKKKYDQIETRLRSVEDEIENLKREMYIGGKYLYDFQTDQWKLGEAKLSLKDLCYMVMDKVGFELGNIEAKTTKIGLIKKQKEK